MLVPGHIWYLDVLVYLVPGRLYSMYRFFFNGRFDTPGAAPRWSVRYTYCVVHMFFLRDTKVRYSYSSRNVIFSCSLVNLLREI